METTQLEVQGWKLRLRVPAGTDPHPVALLLHGWTGDENAMWVFASRLPTDHLLVAPRAPHPASMGGYSWYPPLPQGSSWPQLDAFRPAVEALLALMDAWPGFPAADFRSLRLVGFSQGAALAYAFALLYPERVSALAALAGFLPADAEAHLPQEALAGLPVFITHGRTDPLVPVAQARRAVEVLQSVGARVTYCESDAGHKLSASCYRGLEAFFQQLHR